VFSASKTYSPLCTGPAIAVASPSPVYPPSLNPAALAACAFDATKVPINTADNAVARATPIPKGKPDKEEYKPDIAVTRLDACKAVSIANCASAASFFSCSAFASAAFSAASCSCNPAMLDALPILFNSISFARSFCRLSTLPALASISSCRSATLAATALDTSAVTCSKAPCTACISFCVSASIPSSPKRPVPFSLSTPSVAVFCILAPTPFSLVSSAIICASSAALSSFVICLFASLISFNLASW
jgi:hypothetical protein